MVVLQSDKTPSAIHALLMITQANADPISYTPANEANGVYIYACQICGYCEAYLSELELEQHKYLV